MFILFYLIDNTYSLNLDSLNSSLDCLFENDSLCLWFNDKLRAKEDWEFNKDTDNGVTETQAYFSKFTTKFKTGPQNGDRFKNRSSFFHLLYYFFI